MTTLSTTIALAPPRSARPERRPLPGDLAIWIFIAAELLVFGVLFVVYAFARRGHVADFNAGQALLDQTTGLVNTWVLMTSSYAVVRATQAMQGGGARSCVRWLLVAMALGLVFCALKFAEFHRDAGLGITLSASLFDMFYLLLAGFHFLHVLMGLAMLAFVTLKAHRGGYDRHSHSGLESVASYWHMVDLVWIVLFALVYVAH